jgi:hypothetical protein
VTIDSEEREWVGAKLATLRRIAIGALVVAAAAIALAAVALSRSLHVEVPSGPPTLEASEILVRDFEGNVRGRWSASGISVADRTGRMRAGISLGNEGAPTLTLFSKTGGVRAVVGLGADDTPAVTLHDATSRVRTRIVVGDGDTPSVTITDGQGNVVARLPGPAATPALAERKGGVVGGKAAASRPRRANRSRP